MLDLNYLNSSRVANVIYEVAPWEINTYNKLKRHKEQREYSEDHKQTIEKSMVENGSITDVHPILVNKNGYVVDGWHRYKACVALNIPYHVLVVPTNWKGMIVLNTNKRNWNGWDFAGYWAKKGKKSYKYFLDYSSRYPFVSSGVLVAIFNKDTCRKQKDSKAFKEGKLLPFNLDHVERTLQKLASLMLRGNNPTLDPSTHRKQQFQQAMLQALADPDFNFTKFKKGLTTTKHKLNILAKQVDILREIKKIERKG
jgi:hypothetical protein